MEENVYQKYKEIAKYYKLSNYDIRKLWGIIENICNHEEFIKRCKAPFFHHGTITLGEHILADTVVTYKITKKIKEQKSFDKLIKLETAIYIAMFHDLYEEPWQNNKNKKRFCNKHGFVHPIESVVNAITWFPEVFKSKENSLIIIDGILHHMFPLTVRSIDKTNLDLNNKDKYDKLPQIYKDMIIASTNITKFGHHSFRRSFYLEGRILSRADKIVAFRKELSGFNSYVALVSGYNKKVERMLEKN